ncbi:MAG: hypothetical protein N2378_05425, partial [Chloroflexaceae bacterium]|nr:hypothetical protein [Chloroflexaceae bacterium]
MHYDDPDTDVSFPSWEPSRHDPEAIKALANELRSLVRSGRLRDCWRLPPEEVFDLVGVGGGLLEHDWARVAWYGPLEL